MKIYAVRHGYAGDDVSENDRDPKDLARKLEPEGVDAVSALGAWMVENGEEPSIILHSPVVRAKQTAKILSGLTGAPTREDPNLDIHKPWEMVVKKVAADPKMKRVAIVGHHDNMLPGLRALNFLDGADKFDVDPIAMGEMRILDVDRDSATWDEKKRILPSDLNEVDRY